MAVQRESVSPDFKQQEYLRGAEAQVGGVGSRNAGNTAFDFGQRTPVDASAGHSWKLDMLKGLLGGFAPYAKEIDSNINKNAYLEGQVAAAAQKTEDELESSPITGMWQVAGHRDLMNRLRISDAQAQFDKDLPDLARKSPSEAKSYFDRRREALLPELASSSGQVASALTAQLALDERTGMAKHAAAHTQFISDSIVQTQGDVMRTDFASMKRAREYAMVKPELGKEAYARSVESAAGNLIQGVWLNDRVIPAAKVKYTVESLEHALANDEIAYFDYIANKPIPLPDGTTTTLVSRLPMNEWSKLADKRRTVDERTAVYRNMEARQRYAITEGQIKDGTYEGSWEDLTSYIREGVTRKELTAGDQDNLLARFVGMKGKHNNEALLAGAARRGDLATMYANGSNPADSLGKLVASFEARGSRPTTPMPVQIDMLAEAGQNGTAGAYKLIAERMAPSMAQLLRTDGLFDEQHADIYNRVNTHLDALSSEDRQLAMTELTSGMPDDQQTTLLGIRRRMAAGAAFDQARAEQLEANRIEGAKTAGAKAAQAAGLDKREMQTALDEYNPHGLVSRAWNSVKSVVPFMGTGTNEKDVLAPKTSPLSDDQNKFRYAQQVKDTVQMEAYELLNSNPGVPARDLVLKAAGNVAARTIMTEHGPLILPKGKTTNQLFGLRENEATREELGAAMNTFLKPSQDGNRMAFTVAEGGIKYQEYTPDGAPTNHFGVLNGKSIKPIVDEARTKRFKQSNAIFGSGQSFNTGGLPVQFNGANTASVAAPWVFDLRKNLVQYEGFRAVAYDDKTGKPLVAGEKATGTPTIGVGLTGDYAPKPGPDGKVSKEQLDQAFWKASNDAAAAGRKVANAVGLPQDRNAFLLFSELAYHSGTSFATRLPQYRPMLDAIRSGNKKAAVEAFKATQAYDKSAEDRRKHYIDLINKIG